MRQENILVDAAVDIDSPHIPRGYHPALYRLRHSLAHVLAQAVVEHFQDIGPVRLAIGPPIEHGFYYDFELPRPLTAGELPAIEERMRRIVDGDHAFIMREVDVDEARRLFVDQPYKLELIEDLAKAGTSITLYSQDTFTDLCRGPHVERTSAIDPRAFKLLGVAGSYWRGDEHGPKLQRVYGTAWSTPEDLEKHLWRLAEAEKRDHRRIGRELEIFHLDPTAPGMPYWLPRGVKILNELIAFWRKEHERGGYQEIVSPMLNSKSLWERSGHWDHYKDNMFLAPVDENTTYLAKPMNCPNAMIVYNLKLRSYRELPLRLSDCDMLHRRERSGTLHGLLRVQKIQQDDAHIFLRPDQLEEEFDRILEMAARFYGIFGLKYEYRLGTRPPDFMGESETWDEAESILMRVLDRHVGRANYVIEEGDGAFYGPKIDILMEDVLERKWQMGTLQLDFQIPRRFDCAYVDRDGSAKTPVVIHRVIYGSMERFIGILLEHTAGALPVWLAPVQARAIAISEKQQEYANSVKAALVDAGVRVEIDDSDKRMQAKIRQAELEKVPYIVVVGSRESKDGTVSVRGRHGVDHGSMTVDGLIVMIGEAVESKAA